VERGVYLMAPDGTDVRRISAIVDDAEYGFFSVSWSPDGTSIATKATPGIWLIPVGPHDPADEVMLAESDSVVPTWSPVGSQVAYVDLGASRLRVVPVAGGDAVDLGGLEEGGYAWAPDGTSLAAQRCSAEGCGYEIVDARTGRTVTMIQVSLPGRFPSWQRRTQ
jgi:Tol biopolymer transport system component